MRRPSALTLFMLSAFAGIVVFTLLWTQVSAWTSYPAAWLSRLAMEHNAPLWIREVRLAPGLMEIDTSIAVPVAEAQGRRGELTVEVSPGRYAYGLPIFLGLLMAAGRKRLWARALTGYLLLLPAQAFSLTFHALMQVVMAAQVNVRFLRIAQWQLELIAYCYQVGALVLPTLVPFLLWLWIDRQFVKDVLVRGWQDSLGQRSPAT